MAAFLPCHLRCSFRFSRAGLNNAVLGWSRWTFVRGCSTQVPVVERKPLLLKASEFRHLFELGPTEKIYAGTAVSGLGQAQQGKILQEWARKVLQEKNPKTEILDPESGLRSNGSLRGRHQAKYDFLMGGRRVEIKSSRMAWRSREERWNVQFFRVKIPFGERTESVFDDLYLVLLSPRGLHMIKHDLVTGISTRGKLTEVSGHMIRVYGRTGTNCWEDALNEILWKLCKRGGCSVLGESFGELDLQKKLLSQGSSAAQAAVAGLPMSTMSREKRGKRIEAIGLTIDGMLHPLSSFSLAEGRSGKSNASADWVRGSVRVELKSCLLTFERTRNRWRCGFQGIKPNLFDELWLAIYTSVGTHYYQSKSCSRLGFVKAGVATKIHGYALDFYGPCGELDPLEALKAIQAKMVSRGCKLVAIVEWEIVGEGSNATLQLEKKGSLASVEPLVSKTIPSNAPLNIIALYPHPKFDHQAWWPLAWTVLGCIEISFWILQPVSLLTQRPTPHSCTLDVHVSHPSLAFHTHRGHT